MRQRSTVAVQAGGRFVVTQSEPTNPALQAPGHLQTHPSLARRRIMPEP